MRVPRQFCVPSLNRTFQIKSFLDLSLGAEYICHYNEIKPFSTASLEVLHLIHTIKSSDQRVSINFKMRKIISQNSMKKIEFFMRNCFEHEFTICSIVEKRPRFSSWGLLCKTHEVPHEKLPDHRFWPYCFQIIIIRNFIKLSNQRKNSRGKVIKFIKFWFLLSFALKKPSSIRILINVRSWKKLMFYFDFKLRVF